MKRKLGSIAIALLVLGLAAGPLHSQGMPQTAYAQNLARPNALSETVVAPFINGENAVHTSQSYSGTVGLVISGVGQASSTQYSDAFYVYTDRSGNPITPTSIGWDLYINGQRHTAYINPTLAYSPQHVYTVTITVPQGQISFGVGDTLTSDNTGAYTITVSTPSYAVTGQILDSGGVPLPDVYVSTSDGMTSTTDANGDYTLASVPSGTNVLTPTLAGYSFLPVTRTVFGPPDVTGQDFAAYLAPNTISGHVNTNVGNAPLPGVMVSAGSALSTTSDVNGYFALTNLLDGDYVLTPTLAGYCFSPAAHTETVPPAASNQDYLAIAAGQSTSATVPALHYGMQLAITNLGASSACIRNTYYDASGTLIARYYRLIRAVTTFTATLVSPEVPPAYAGYAVIGSDQPLTATAGSGVYSVSGHIADSDGQSLGGVSVHSNAGANAVTNGSGDFAFANVAGGTYIVTPTLSGYSFVPITQTASVPPDATGIDFTGVALTYTIAGRVVDSGGAPVSGASVTMSSADGDMPYLSVNTNVSGSYIITGVLGGTYMLTPYGDTSGNGFTPVTRTVSVPPDATGQDFVANSSAKLPIVLLPGIMASRLSNTPSTSAGCLLRPNGEIWPNLLGLTNPNVYNNSLATLELAGDGPRPASDCDVISPTGILANITLGLPIVDQDYYALFTTDMADAGYPVYSFAYDWRLDLGHNAQLLGDFINATVLAKTHASKVILVAHSMGGLLARKYISDSSRAAHVDTVVSVGTPYWGAPDAGWSMRTGATHLPFDSLIDKSMLQQVIRNSPGMMELLPSDAWFQQVGGYYWDGDTLLQTSSSTRDFFTANRQNGTLLQLAQSFHAGLDDFNLNLPPTVRYYVLAANHLVAVNQVREYPCWGIGTCWQEMSYFAGDGSVPWASARLSGAAGDWAGTATVCTFSKGDVTHDHAALMSDPGIITAVLSILGGGKPSVCGSATQAKAAQSAPLPIVQVALWGTAKLTVQDNAGRVDGTDNNGWTKEEIPYSTFHSDSTGTFAVLPGSAVYTVTVHSMQNSSVQLQVTDYRATMAESAFTPNQRAVFAEVPMVTSGTAALRVDLSAGLPNLNLHLANGQGAVTGVLSPTSVLDAQQVQDLIPPVTTITVQGTHTALGLFTGPVTVTLSATDAGVGVLKTEYSLDGGSTWHNYVNALHLVAEQTPIVLARSIDVAGNEEYPGVSRRLVAPFQLYLPLVMR